MIKVDNKWMLEGFVIQKNAKPGWTSGYVGIGQGGGKMVDAIASIKDPATGDQVYPCIVINSNEGDMKNLKNVSEKYKLGLHGYEGGVGKDPEMGKQAFLQNGAPIFDAIASVMENCDIIYVAVSLGGGTGTGAINDLVDAISRYIGKPVIAITSMPQPNEIESRNAYNALAELAPKLTIIEEDDNDRQYRLLESLIVLDNEKIVNDHMRDPEAAELNLSWDQYSNYKLASLLHEWSVLTSLGSDYTVDAADLKNHVLLKGGILTFAKRKINLDEFKNKEDLIDEIVETYKGRNVLANGFDYTNDMRSMALVIVMPRKRQDMVNTDTLEKIRSRIKSELPNVNFYPGCVTHGSERHAVVYTMANMAGLPERAKNLRKEAEDLLTQRLEAEKNASGFNLGDKLEVSTSNTTVRKAPSTKVNTFASTGQAAATSEQAAVKKKPFNPFA